MEAIALDIDSDRLLVKLINMGMEIYYRKKLDPSLFSQ